MKLIKVVKKDLNIYMGGRHVGLMYEHNRQNRAHSECGILATRTILRADFIADTDTTDVFRLKGARVFSEDLVQDTYGNEHWEENKSRQGGFLHDAESDPRLGLNEELHGNSDIPLMLVLCRDFEWPDVFGDLKKVLEQ